MQCELTSRIVSRLKETFKGEERELKLRNVALAFRILNTPSVCCCVHTQIVAEAGSGNGTDRGTKAHDLPSKLCERHPSAKVRLAGLYCGEGSAGEIQARLAFGDSELNECKDLMQRFATDAGKNSSPEISGRRENVEGCFVKGFLTIIRQIELNAFTVIDDRQRSVGAALYLNPSLFNHSCVPNLFALYNTDFSSPPLPTSSPCSAATTDGVTGVWQELKLLRDVEAGEELMHSYCDLARPRFERKAMLLKNYHFSCACSACSVAPSSGRRVDGRLIWKNLAESLEKANEEVTAKGIDPYYASDRMTRIREALCKVEGTDFDMELNLNRQGDCRVVDRSLPCYAEDLTRDVNRKYPFTSCSCDTVCSCLGIDDGGHRWLQQQCALLDSERARLRLEMPEPHLLNAETNVKATLELLHVFFRVWKGCEARLGFFNLSKYSILSEVYSLALDAGEDVLALELLPDIIAVQKAIYQPVPRHPLPLLLLQTLADLLAANGAEKAAAHLNARLLPDLSIVFGPHHPFTEHCSKGAL